MGMFIAMLFVVAKNGNSFKSSSSDWINEQWLSYIMEYYYPAIKSDELVTRGTICMSLELIMVAHVIQKEYIYCMLHLYQILESVNKSTGRERTNPCVVMGVRTKWRQRSHHRTGGRMCSALGYVPWFHCIHFCQIIELYIFKFAGF